MVDRYYALETKFGRMWLRPTSADHIYVSGGSNLNVEEEYPVGSRMGPVQVNGVTYAANAHCYLEPDGVWRTRRGQSVSLWRYPGTGRQSDEGSMSAREKLDVEIGIGVTAWAATEEGRRAIRRAEAERLHCAIGHATERFAAAQEEAREAMAELVKFREQLATLYEQEVDMEEEKR